MGILAFLWLYYLWGPCFRCSSLSFSDFPRQNQPSVLDIVVLDIFACHYCPLSPSPVFYSFSSRLQPWPVWLLPTKYNFISFWTTIPLVSHLLAQKVFLPWYMSEQSMVLHLAFKPRPWTWCNKMLLLMSSSFSPFILNSIEDKTTKVPCQSLSL